MVTPCVSREQAKRLIDDEVGRPQSNKVLHAHPGPMYWHPDDGTQSERLRARLELAQTQAFSSNLYLGIPFCIPTEPAHCGFCLFPTQDYRGNTSILEYLSYLDREADLYAPYFRYDHLASIYVGGGTPNLLRAEEYHRLMAIAEKLYRDIPGDIEKTVEGIPQLFTREKVQAIKEAGFNRVSMGVQQMSDELIKYSGRRQTHKQVIDALDSFNEAKLAANVDLIYGWPEQTTEGMLRDLGELVDLGVRHITHYQLNVAGKSNFSKVQRAVLPPMEAVIEMYQESQHFLKGKGFRQETVYDWERIDGIPGRFETGNAHRYQYESILRDPFPVEEQKVSETRNMIGLGYAACGFPVTWPAENGPNWCYMNSRSLETYYRQIGAGRLPIDRQFSHNKDDLKLVWVFQSSQKMALDLDTYAVAFQSDLLADFAAIFDELESRGWIEVDTHRIRYVGLGQFHIPLIQALFSYARLAELRSSLKQGTTGGTVIPISEVA